MKAELGSVTLSHSLPSLLHTCSTTAILWPHQISSQCDHQILDCESPQLWTNVHLVLGMLSWKRKADEFRMHGGCWMEPAVGTDLIWPSNSRNTTGFPSKCSSSTSLEGHTTGERTRSASSFHQGPSCYLSAPLLSTMHLCRKQQEPRWEQVTWHTEAAALFLTALFYGPSALDSWPTLQPSHSFQLSR